MPGHTGDLFPGLLIGLGVMSWWGSVCLAVIVQSIFFPMKPSPKDEE
jgi:hypothetical protein